MVPAAQALEKRRLRQFCPAVALDKFELGCKKPQKSLSREPRPAVGRQ
jgi:hypothetical protein